MKKLLLSLTFVAATYMAQGQHLIGNTGDKDAVIKLKPGAGLGYITPRSTLNSFTVLPEKNPKWLTISSIVTGIIMTVDRLPMSGNIDSLIIHVRKSQVRWVNDSTAIVNKPK